MYRCRVMKCLLSWLVKWKIANRSNIITAQYSPPLIVGRKGGRRGWLDLLWSWMYSRFYLIEKKEWISRLPFSRSFLIYIQYKCGSLASGNFVWLFSIHIRHKNRRMSDPTTARWRTYGRRHSRRQAPPVIVDILTSRLWLTKSAVTAAVRWTEFRRPQISSSPNNYEWRPPRPWSRAQRAERTSN